MAMNKAAKAIVQQTLPYSKDVASHDWWMYIVITAYGGHVHYDPMPSLLYRQHPQNLIGSNVGVRAKLQRLKILTSGGFKEEGQRAGDRRITRKGPEDRRISRQRLHRAGQYGACARLARQCV